MTTREKGSGHKESVNPESIPFTRKYGVSPDPLLKGTWLIPTQDILLLEMDFEGNSFYIM